MTRGARGRSRSRFLALRGEVARFWAVTADRPFLYKPGAWGRLRGLLLVPLKKVLRKLMRWYVEPAFAQQRNFNSRVLQALDELSERVDAVAGELDATVDAANHRIDPIERTLAG